MEKRFLLKWTNTDKTARHSYDPAEKEETLPFFNEDNGYLPQDIKAIKNLKKGENYNCVYGNHLVERII